MHDRNILFVQGKNVPDLAIVSSVGNQLTERVVMSGPAQNVAGGRYTKSEISHSSGKGIVIDDTVLASSTVKNGILHNVGSTVTENKVLRDAMVTDAVNNPGYISSNLSDKDADLMVEWLNSTTNHIFPDSGESGLNLTDLLDCDMFNDSLCLFPNASNGNGTDSLEQGGYAYWSLLLLIFPLFTVFGNVLVVLSIYRERTLRHVTNYFICSLAVADIMVAVVVMPPAVYMEVSFT